MHTQRTTPGNHSSWRRDPMIWISLATLAATLAGLFR
jgi:hypothetical protein